MPPVETLNEHSDYSGFFSSKVSEELRRLALRKLFHSPVFNVTDGLDDYAEDYTTFAKLGNIVTHDMRRMMGLEAHRAKTPAGSDTASLAETVVCDGNGADPSGDKIAAEAAESTQQEAPAESRNDEDLDA
jgi:CobQ-like glutamine amidotransferase family enzyme